MTGNSRTPPICFIVTIILFCCPVDKSEKSQKKDDDKNEESEKSRRKSDDNSKTKRRSRFDSGPDEQKDRKGGTKRNEWDMFAEVDNFKEQYDVSFVNLGPVVWTQLLSHIRCVNK